MAHATEPLVSIIVPTHNRQDFLREALESVFSQTYTNWELIVVDDGSTDGTLSYLATLRDPRIHIMELEHCGNPAKLRNVGIARARGSYVAFLDSDDLWYPCKLDVQIRRLLMHRGPRWSYSNFRRMDLNGDEIPFARPGEKPWVAHSGWILDELASVDAIVVTPTVIAERSLLAEVGAFDESFIASEDYDLWFRLAMRSEVAAEELQLAAIRHHGTSHTRVHAHLYQDWIRACENLIKRTEHPGVRAACRRNCGDAMLRLAGSYRRAREYRRAVESLFSALRYRPGVFTWLTACLKTGVHAVLPSAMTRAHQLRASRSDVRNKI